MELDEIIDEGANLLTASFYDDADWKKKELQFELQFCDESDLLGVKESPRPIVACEPNADITGSGQSNFEFVHGNEPSVVTKSTQSVVSVRDKSVQQTRDEQAVPEIGTQTEQGRQKTSSETFTIVADVSRNFENKKTVSNKVYEPSSNSKQQKAASTRSNNDSRCIPDYETTTLRRKRAKNDVVYCEWCQLDRNRDLIEEAALTKYCSRCGEIMFLCLKHLHIPTVHVSIE